MNGETNAGNRLSFFIEVFVLSILLDMGLIEKKFGSAFDNRNGILMRHHYLFEVWSGGVKILHFLALNVRFM